MMKSCVMMLAAFAATGLSLAADGPAPPARVEDERAIRDLIDRQGKAWNAHDMKAFSKDLDEDVAVVNRYGQWMTGRAAVELHLTGLHASPFRDHLVGRSSEVERIRFLAPDVALVHERAKEEAGQSIRTYVLQRRDGRWLVRSVDVIEQKAPPAG